MRVKTEQTARAGVDLYVKREDMNHPLASGNKWWKLKHNLRRALEVGHTTLLTIGGAYSNHIYATAAAAHALGLQSIGVVRGESADALNPTLSFAQQQGMRLHFVDRTTYRSRATAAFEHALEAAFGRFYFLPEGGTNADALKGCAEWGQLLGKEIKADYVCLPVGSGGTLAGLAASMPRQTLLGFSALAGGTFLHEQVAALTTDGGTNWHIETGYSWGGYGKAPDELIQFILDFEQRQGIPLDPVYTGKMMYGLLHLMEKGRFERGATVVALHTGGLQGRAGFSKLSGGCRE